MRVCLSGVKKSGYSEDLLKDFFNFLQSELPLKKDVNIVLSQERDGNMTTGVRRNHEMVILVGGRMLIDVLRTLSHEWVHEFQFQKMGLPEDASIPDIGGPVENMASVLGGIYMKKFQKDFPQYEEELYGNNQ
jgi:hypothetical protein